MGAEGKDKIKVYIYAWKQYSNDRKHMYVKIEKDGKVIQEQGGGLDSIQFFSPLSAITWANKFIEDNYPDCEIEHVGIGDDVGKRYIALQNNRYVYLTDGD